MGLMTLQYQTGVGLLKHDGFTNPGQSGKLMGECCCDDDACQWAIDWLYVCIGRCNGDPSLWEETQSPSTITGDVHNPAAWAASTLYATPGQLVLYDGLMYGLKIKHTSGLTFDPDYWISASGWIAYQNGATGTVTPATYPGANAYQHTTDANVQGAPPAPGVHCSSQTVPVGVNHNMYGCSATRYGTIHRTQCPVVSDVSTDAPTACEHSAMCGSCVMCGPTLTGGQNCHHDNFVPGVLPCSISVSFDFTVTSTGFRIQGTQIVNMTDCSTTYTFPNASTRKYIYTNPSSLPSCPAGAMQVRDVSIYYYYNGSSGTEYWSFAIGFAYCDGATQKTFSVSGGYNVSQPCNPTVVLTGIPNFTFSEPATNPELIITSNNP